jgi:ribosomal subunit interface protein
MQVRYTANGFTLKTELEKYAADKVASLSRHVPRQLRRTAKCSARFNQTRKKSATYSNCQLTLEVGSVVFQANETTLHMYAALDIATVNVEQQLRDYRRRLRTGGVRERLKLGLRSQWL